MSLRSLLSRSNYELTGH